jgi:hypothetical protein
MASKIYYISDPERPTEESAVDISALNIILNHLNPGATMHVTTRERHAFIKVTEKYPGGAPSLRSFFDVCGMPECDLPSTDPVHY